MSVTTFTPIDVPGSAVTAVHGISTRGTVVGGYANPMLPDGTSSGVFAFSEDRGAFTTIPLGTPPDGGVANAINPAGTIIVGSYGRGFDARGAFMDNRGTITHIDWPGRFRTTPLGVSANGVVVGYGTAPQPTGPHGFIYENGTFSILDVPGSAPGSTIPRGINGAGTTIVGQDYSANADGSFSQHGFIDDKGVFSSLDVPGATGTSLAAISARGTIVGSYYGSDSVQHSFIYDKGVFTNIDLAGVSSQTVFGINANGTTLVGTYGDGTTTHGFEAPVSAAIREGTTLSAVVASQPNLFSAPDLLLPATGVGPSAQSSGGSGTLDEPIAGPGFLMSTDPTMQRIHPPTAALPARTGL